MFTDIIWDFDGTLFDTYPATAKAFQKALRVYHIEEASSTIQDYLKISEGYAVAHFKKEYALDDRFDDVYDACKRAIPFEDVKPFPYAAEVCAQIAASGGRNYMITHRGGSTLTLLGYYGMMPSFTEVVTKRYGFARKPNPEAFLYLIDKYQMDRCSVMVVGDRDLEILAGKAAGISTCLYNTNGIVPSEEPDFHIESLNNLLDIIHR